MPLTKFQEKIARLIAINRDQESHLAGGAGIHILPQSTRYSNDLDYFNDSDKRVAAAFLADESLLKENGYSVKVEMRQPGYIRAMVGQKKDLTKLEWAYDSAWRFMPVIRDEVCGYILHPIDLAINKVLTLASRNEPRDFLDTLYVHEHTLSLGALCWAAVGKDPGFNPRSLLEILQRRGQFREEDFSRLHLVKPVSLELLKKSWRKTLSEAEAFIKSRPSHEVGALYFSLKTKKFIEPSSTMVHKKDYELHYGQLGGVLPKF